MSRRKAQRGMMILSSVALVMIFLVGCGRDQASRPESPSLSTGVSGSGGTPQDYGDIRLVIELSTNAISENNSEEIRATTCREKRAMLSGEINDEFSSSTFGSVVVNSVSDINVTGDSATAHVVLESGEERYPQDLELRREGGKWLVC